MGANVNTDERRDTEGSTRRSVLAAAGAAGFLAGAPNLVGGQDTPTETPTDDETPTDGETPTEGGTPEADATIVLGGRVEYWLGLAPESIEGEENPALELTEGETYEIVWINLDGAEHELIVEDADGEELFESDSNEAVGETASATVEASEEVAEYYCEYHADSMRGTIELGEDTETTGTETETETPTGTETPTETEAPAGNGGESTPEY